MGFFIFLDGMVKDTARILFCVYFQNLSMVNLLELKKWLFKNKYKNIGYKKTSHSWCFFFCAIYLPRCYPSSASMLLPKLPSFHSSLTPFPDPKLQNINLPWLLVCGCGQQMMWLWFKFLWKKSIQQLNLKNYLKLEDNSTTTKYYLLLITVSFMIDHDDILKHQQVL
jgi:hypothetical protein